MYYTSIDDNVRISGGGSSGKLLFQHYCSYGDSWYTVCRDGFDDNAGDVACHQLGYAKASNVYTQ